MVFTVHFSSLSLRLVPGLALASSHFLCAPGSDAGADVLHARDATLPALSGQEGRGPGGSALSAGARCLA